MQARFYGAIGQKSHIGETDLANTPLLICVCALDNIEGFYLQYVFAALSNVANHRHIC